VPSRASNVANGVCSVSASHRYEASYAVKPVRIASANTADGSTECISIEEASARVRRLFPSGTPSSTALLREMRDGRYGIGPARKARPRKSGVR